MFEILNYLRVRYVDEKAQGMAEYALLLAFVVGIAALVLTKSSTDGLGGAIKSAFDSVAAEIKTLSGKS